MRFALSLVLLLQDGLAAGPARKLGGDMQFTEGPVADAKGHVYFSDIPSGKIMKWDGVALTVWREVPGGTNGLKFDREGRLYCCEVGAKRVTRITAQGTVEVVVDEYDGKKFNAPNDLSFDAKGGLYFTDPNYRGPDNKTQDVEAVYYVPPGGGKALRVADDLVKPNGIEAADGRVFVADAGDGKIYLYAANDDGTLRDRKLFCEVRCDGLKLDEKGNLYTTTGRGVQIFDPDGKLLETIEIPETPANCCFAGTTLFVTARTSLYAVSMSVKGR